MDEILLTRMQMKPLFHKARKLFKEAVARDEEIPEDEAAFVNEYICQAQVAKVVECATDLDQVKNYQMNEDKVTHTKSMPIYVWEGDLLIRRSDVQALRVAAGMEGGKHD